MGVRGDFAASHVSRLGGGFELFEGKLRRTGVVSLGENAAGGENFYDVDAILHLGANHVPDLIDAVGDLEVALVGEHYHPRLRGKIVQIAVAAGDGDGRTAGHDARAGNQSFIDAVAEIDGEKWQRADVPHGGESGFERFAGVHDREEGTG